MKRLIYLLLICVFVLGSAIPATAQTGRPDRPLPQGLKLETPITIDAPKLDARLNGAQGPQQVIVSLKGLSVAELATSDDTKLDKTPRALKNQLKNIKTQQAALIRFAQSLDPKVEVLGRTQRVINTVALQIDGAALKKLVGFSDILVIRPVVNYEADLENAVPYVGGTAVHEMGFTGKGVTVAIIDSGVDYTHALLGGSGDVADYENNDPNIIEPGTFPTEKVIGGYDFVGANWPNTGLQPDPDPLDKPTYVGHGTHVASIAAGLTGMAPDASIYALKVCSSVTNSCSGVAMVEALDWILDPNGDGDLSDHVDVANMSIGSPYGQPLDDDASRATEIAARAGVLVVTSTGNSSDKPYIGGTPGATPSALAVAATNNPVAGIQLIRIVSPAAIAGNIAAVWQPWSAPLTVVIEAPVKFDSSSTAKRLGCTDANGGNPYTAGEYAGKIGLVDRGTCSISMKVSNLASAGAVAAVIGLVAPGDPTEFAFGGGTPSIPGFNITQADANKIKSQLAAGVVLNLDPNNVEPQKGVVMGFSSRGPSTLNNLKPDMAAPGSITAAETGSGAGLVTLAGTSMASPMVAGAGALLKQAKPTLSNYELKALLVQSAETDILNKALISGGKLAPITRIGGGELRIDRAVEANASALEVNTRQASLSFGFVDVDHEVTLTKSFMIRNYSDKAITYAVQPAFRFAEDEASGAVTLTSNMNQVFVPAHKASGLVQITMKINPLKLHEWMLNSGSQGASGNALTAEEFDGYIWLDDLTTDADNQEDSVLPDLDGHPNMMHIAWQVLPRLSGEVVAPMNVTAGAEYPLANTGDGPAYIDTYSLLGVSDPLPPYPIRDRWGANAAQVDLKAFGVTTFPVPAGYCSANASFVMAFAVTIYDRVAHANAPEEFDIYLDTNRDGNPDYVVYNFDVSGTTSFDGRNATFVANLATGKASALFLTDHPTNSADFVMYFCGEQIGMNATNFGQLIDTSIYAFDWYNSGALTDAIEGMVFAPAGERFVAAFGNGDFYSTNLAPHTETTLTALDLGPNGTNPNELGLLLINTGFRGSVSSGADPAHENNIVLVQP